MKKSLIVILLSCFVQLGASQDEAYMPTMDHGEGYFLMGDDGTIAGRKLKLSHQDRESRYKQIEQRIEVLKSFKDTPLALSVPDYQLKKKDKHWVLRWDQQQHCEGVTVYEPFVGGCTNCVFMAGYKNRPCILRLSRDGAEELGICRNRELACLKAASKAGVCPKLRYAGPRGEILVQDYVAGEVLFGKEGADISCLEELVHLMKVYHKTHYKPAMAQATIFVQVAEMLELAADSLNEKQRDFASRALEDLQKDLEGKGKYGLCHNDLWLQNVIRDTSGRLWVIDWEYGGWGSVYRDLATVCVPNRLSDEDCQRVVKHYFDAKHDKHETRLLGYRTATTLWESLWCLIQGSHPGPHSKGLQKAGEKRYEDFVEILSRYQQKALGGKGPKLI